MQTDMEKWAVYMHTNKLFVYPAWACVCAQIETDKNIQ